MLMNMKKIFLFFLFTLFISQPILAQKELYNCTDIDFGGFNYDGNNYKLVLYNLEQFDLFIDASNRVVESNHLFIGEPVCLDSFNLAYLTCSTTYGETLMFNLSSFDYSFSSIFGHTADEPSDSGYQDPLSVRFGTCRKL